MNKIPLNYIEFKPFNTMENMTWRQLIKAILDKGRDLDDNASVEVNGEIMPVFSVRNVKSGDSAEGILDDGHAVIELA